MIDWLVDWWMFKSKSCRKNGLISLSIYWIHTKKFLLCFNFITKIDISKYLFKLFLIIFISYNHFECTQWPLLWRQVVVSYFEISSGSLFRIKLYLESTLLQRAGDDLLLGVLLQGKGVAAQLVRTPTVVHLFNLQLRIYLISSCAFI